MYPLCALMKSLRSSGAVFFLGIALLLSGGAYAQSLPYNFDFTSSPFTAGWTEFSVSGAQVWTYNSTFSNASMSAFAGSCQVNEDWLISPAFNLSSSSNEALTVAIQRGFTGDNGLEILYSTNYSGSGDPNAATWTFVDEAVASDFTANNTNVDFGPYTGFPTAATSLYIAFKFDYASGACSTWRIGGFTFEDGSAPALTLSETNIGNLNYDEGAGPSAPQTYTISGSQLVGTGNITVTASSGFQVSLNNVFYGTTVSVPFASGVVNSQPRTLFVRLASGQAIGDYSGTVTHTGGGATATLNVSGSVSLAGVTVIDFEGAGETKTSYVTGNVFLSGTEWTMTNVLIGTDAADFKNGARSARLRGYGDTEFVTAAAKQGGIGSLSFVYARYSSDTQVAYVAEYSTDGGSSWTQIGSEFTATETPAIFFEQVDEPNDALIRFRTVPSTGTSNRRMNMDDIVITDFGVGFPQIFAAPAAITDLNYSVGNGPSAAQSYALSAVGLSPASGNIAVTAPANFQVSNNGTTWSSSINVAYTASGTSIANNEVFVRLAAGLSSGTYTGNITHTAGSGSASVSVSGEVAASLNPELFALASGSYSFTEWSNEAGAGAYPANMRFLMSNDPSAAGFDPLADGTRLFNCDYNLSSRPRFQGLGANGFSMLSTGSPQYNNCASGAADNDRYVGSAVIGLNTQTVGFARIEWLNRLVTEGERDFTVRLQYRVGDSGGYTDFAGNPEYSSLGKVAGDTAVSNFILPAAVLGQSEVYLRFNYFQLGTGSGTRPEMGIDNILITTTPLVAPLLSLSEGTLSGFYYTENSGPSTAQSYTLSGVNLEPAAGVLNLTASGDFQISLDGNTYSSALTLGYNAGAISENIFVRMAPGLSAGNYTGAVSHSGGSALAVNLTLTGEVGYPVNLGVGDVFITGYRSVANDGIAFANWVDMPAGTVLLFTDRAWTGTELLSNENLCIWQNTTGNSIPAGTVIKIGGPEFGNGTGVSQGTILSGSLDGLAQAGDNIFVLQGSVNQPIFIYGLSFLSEWLTEGAVSNPTSYLPSALNTPFGNIVINDLNGQYNGARENESTFTAYKTLVSNPANWTTNADGGLFGDFNTDPFVLSTAVCTANGGTLQYTGTRSFCVGTGTPKAAVITVVGASGSFQRWGLFNSAGQLVDSRGGNSQFNLDSYAPGDYTIRYIRYESDVDITQITSFASILTLEGCFGTSNGIQLFLREEPNAGTLTATTATTVCANSGPSANVQLSLSGFSAQNRRYVLTSQSLGNQVVLQNAGSASGTTFNLNGLPAGTYRAAALGFQQGVDLAGVQFQSQLAGCFDLSNLVTINITNCLSAELGSQPNPTTGSSFVTFTNPREEYATLEVYDMSGRMVERLFNQVTQAGVEYRMEFNGHALPNGVYLYRLTTGAEVVVNKFMIAR